MFDFEIKEKVANIWEKINWNLCIRDLQQMDTKTKRAMKQALNLAVKPTVTAVAS